MNIDLKQGQVKEPETNEDKKEQDVTVPMSLLENLQKEITELKAEVRQKKESNEEEEDIEPVNKHSVRLREHDGKIVIGYNKERGTWKKYDNERREDRLMQEIIVLVDGKESVEEVDYIRFMEEAKEVEVPLLKISKKEVVVKKGYVKVKEVVDYKTLDTSQKIMQKVISSVDTATVVMPDGTEREINVDFLNM